MSKIMIGLSAVAVLGLASSLSAAPAVSVAPERETPQEATLEEPMPTVARDGSEWRAAPKVVSRRVLLLPCPEFCGYNDLSIPNPGWFRVTRYANGTTSHTFLGCWVVGSGPPPGP